MDNDSTINVNVQQAVPFFMVRNMEISIDYYVKGIGFQIKNNWIVEGKIRWCWLEIGKAALMLQEFSEELDTQASNDVLGTGVSIYFICEDALTIYKQILSRGISVSEPFVGNNMWVVGFTDPDGYKIYFESLTDVPEETKYSDWIKPSTS